MNATTLLDELRKIITETRWSPAERIAFATLLLSAESAGDHWRVVDNMTAKKLADMTGISERSAQDILPRLRDAGIVDYAPETAAVNRMGEPIPTKSASRARGDRFIKTPYVISIPAQITTLPALSESANTTKARESSQDRRREFAEMKVKLDNLLSVAACPHCGEVGHLHGEIIATCTSCGSKVDERELAELIDGAEMPAPQTLRPAPTSANRTEPAPQTLRPAPRPLARRLRELRGRPTAPPPAIDYANFADTGIAIDARPQNLRDISLDAANFADTSAPQVDRGRLAQILKIERNARIEREVNTWDT